MPVVMTELVQEIETIFKEHSRMIYRTALSVTGGSQDAEDVLQAIFLRLIRQFPSELGRNPQAYLYRAAVNSSLNLIRERRRRREESIEHAEHCDTEILGDSVDKELEHRRLYEAIAELKPDVAQILIFRYMHNKSDAEKAEILGVSRGAIALKLFRSRARLKNLLRASSGDQL
jgi:RNA polymerase sigma factor (sigma-70 family)